MLYYRITTLLLLLIIITISYPSILILQHYLFNIFYIILYIIKEYKIALRHLDILYTIRNIVIIIFYIIFYFRVTSYINIDSILIVSVIQILLFNRTNWRSLRKQFPHLFIRITLTRYNRTIPILLRPTTYVIISAQK